MRKIILIISAIICSLTVKAQWKAYMSYYEPTEIEQAGDGLIYVLASNGLYSYNTTDHQLTTYDKTTVLNDCDITHIAWCQAARRLVITYDDYNIDVLSPNGNVVNISAYMNASMTDDKTINSIDIAGRYAYLSTNFGIIQIDVANASIANTYRLGFRVNYTYTEGNYLYAASQTNGLNRGLLTSNLLDPSQWTRVGGYRARPKTMDANMLAMVRTLNPGGPKYNYFGEIKFKYGNLYTVSGGYGPALELNYPGTVQVLRSNGDWQIYQDSLQKITGHGYTDNLTIDVDPRDTSHVFVGGRTGLYEFRSGRYVNEYSYDNSPLQPAISNAKDYLIIEGITFDRNGSLWILNSSASTQSVIELTRDNQFVSHHSPTFIASENNASLTGMVSPFIDSRNILWFGNQHWYTPGLFGYNIGNQQTYKYTTFTNEDATSYTDVRVTSVKEDDNNNLWIGTNKGPFVFEEYQMSYDNPIFTQVKVPRNDGTDFADYLLSNVPITSIAIDRANRKWFATSGNGLYLIGNDNITQLQHFTSENSPLLSNNVNSIAIDEAKGIVYIATDKGLCSYTSIIPSSADGMTKDNVYAYPNPVRPGYTGAITITGLTNNADVKITTTNGALVYEGKASGGEYRWYGLDKEGKRVASGVYMVEVATAEGEKGVVCKIAIVR